MPTTFPHISLTDAILQYWDAMPPDWQQITEKYEYEDGGEDFNEVADSAPKRWRYEVVCNGATHAQAKAIADIYDTFFDLVRYSQPFDFEDKYGTTWSNVRIEEYTRSHDAHKSWVIFCRFTLKGNSADYTDIDAPSVPTGLTVELL